MLNIKHPAEIELEKKFGIFINQLTEEETIYLLKRVQPGKNGDGLGIEFSVNASLLMLEERNVKTKLHNSIISQFKDSDWEQKDLERLLTILSTKDKEQYDLNILCQIKFEEFDKLNNTLRNLFTTKLIDQITYSCPNIVTLSFGTQKTMTCENIIYMVKKYKNLKELSFSQSHLSAEQINDILKQAYASLTALDLSGCSINKETVRLLTEKFKSLESINLDQAKFIEQSINEQRFFIEQILRKLENLKYVNLEGFDFIDDKIIQLFQSFGERLEHLHLTSKKLTSNSLSNLLRECRNITSLSIPGCSSVDNNVLDTIALRLRNLRKLNICSTGITSVGLKSFVEDHTSLKGAEIIIDSKIIEQTIRTKCEEKSIILTMYEPKGIFILYWTNGSVSKRPFFNQL